MLNQLRFTLSYLSKPRWDTCISPPELMDFILCHPPGKTLDLGCGTGTNVLTLARHGWTATGVDFVGLAIRAARQKAYQSGLTAKFIRGDVTRIEINDTDFDLILDIGCFHNLDSRQKSVYIRNVERLLSPAGTFLLYGFAKEDPGSSKPGMAEDDVKMIQAHLHLAQRRDSTDHGQRQSAWFTFVKI